MGQKWIIDVLADLRAFADQNGLPLLAHQLDVTATVANAEIASLIEGAPRTANVNASQAAGPVMPKLDQATELSALQTCSEALRDLYEVAHLGYHWVSSDGEQYGCGTYSLEWVAQYVKNDYVRIDPVIIGCFQRFHPVDWKQLDWSSKAAQAFRMEAIKYGVGNQGYSIPIRGPSGQFALFTLSHDATDKDWADFTETHRRDLILCAHSFNQKALEVDGQRLPEPVKPLSGREVDVLTYLAVGYSRGQVAQTLNISEHTLRAYVESARFKLGATNTTHAIARAVSEGLIIMGGVARNARGDHPYRDEITAAE